MKVSVSLPDEDVEFLDDYAAAQGIPLAIRRLAQGCSSVARLGARPYYEAAWTEWSAKWRRAALGSNRRRRHSLMRRGEICLVDLEPW